MKTSIIVGALAIAVAGVLATGHALGGELVIKETAQQKLERREAMRRAALAQHQQKKDYLARNCTKRNLSAAEFEACRAAYRQL
jgi:hypothetical protein